MWVGSCIHIVCWFFLYSGSFAIAILIFSFLSHVLLLLLFLYSLPIICSYILSFDSYLFHICFTAASHLLHICFTFALHLLYICVIFALHLLHICLTFALHLNCICLTSASHLPYISFRFASDLHYICITFALQSNHICFTFESHLPWNWFGLGWACFLAGATRVTASPES